MGSDPEVSTLRTAEMRFSKRIAGRTFGETEPPSEIFEEHGGFKPIMMIRPHY